MFVKMFKIIVLRCFCRLTSIKGHFMDLSSVYCLIFWLPSYLASLVQKGTRSSDWILWKPNSALWTCCMWLLLVRRQAAGNCHRRKYFWAGWAGERWEVRRCHPAVTAAVRQSDTSCLNTCVAIHTTTLLIQCLFGGWAFIQHVALKRKVNNLQSRVKSNIPELSIVFILNSLWTVCNVYAQKIFQQSSCTGSVALKRHDFCSVKSF